MILFGGVYISVGGPSKLGIMAIQKESLTISRDELLIKHLNRERERERERERDLVVIHCSRSINVKIMQGLSFFSVLMSAYVSSTKSVIMQLLSFLFSFFWHSSCDDFT